jgi:NADH dehydrogenase FAD-containing subunit
VKKTLLLVGGGHAHIEVLRQLALHPVSNADVALFNPIASVWCGAMLPGVIAGHYEPSAAKVNLWALCQRARVRFFETPVLSIDATQRALMSGLGEQHHFDLVSIDVGCVSRPIPSLAGSYVVTARPIEPLLAAINEFEAVRSSQLMVRFVGSDALTVELALALAYRWRDAKNRRIAIVADAELLQGYGQRARLIALQACEKLGVSVLEHSPVEQIEPTRLRIGGGADPIDTQLTVLSSEFAPAPLLGQIDVSRSPDGRVAVNSMLQSVSHAHLFAVGDCASVGQASASGGRATATSVQQGPAFAANILTALRSDAPLKPVAATSASLQMIVLGEKRALITRKGLSLASRWSWQWRDSIDRKWMQRYTAV